MRMCWFMCICWGGGLGVGGGGVNSGSKGEKTVYFESYQPE